VPQSALDLGNDPAGEIDQHIFKDPTDGKTYLLWKTDDNSVGAKVTRLWGVEVAISWDSVKLLGARKQLMDRWVWWVGYLGGWCSRLVEGLKGQRVLSWRCSTVL
jgi:hypothetical protein